jgi:undecaprenyl-diphosphatase
MCGAYNFAMMALIGSLHLDLAATAPLTWFQAVVLGVLQGVTELFPISSLGHTVLFPTLFGWDQLVRAQSDPESFWLAFVVMLHVGSAVGLLIYFWRDWVEIVRAFFVTLRRRQISTATERLAWLIIVTSIPTGILGLVFEHPVRVALAKPGTAAVFLMVNGVVLLGAERLRRRAEVRALAARAGPGSTREISSLSYREGVGIGLVQSTALIPGISRDGVCMTAGLLRGLNNEDAARFAFLLATPIILAAGVFKFSDLTGPLGAGIRGQAVVAAVCAAIAAIVAVHYLLRYFRTRTLVPFGIYCLVFGLAMVIYTTVT